MRKTDEDPIVEKDRMAFHLPKFIIRISDRRKATSRLRVINQKWLQHGLNCVGHSSFSPLIMARVHRISERQWSLEKTIRESHLALYRFAYQRGNNFFTLE